MIANRKESTEADDLRDVELAARRVLDTLRRYSASKYFTENMPAWIGALSDSESRLDAVRSLHAATHIKALGDLYLAELKGYEWPDMVAELGGAARRYIERHDPNAPVGNELGFNRHELETLTMMSLPTRPSGLPRDELEPLRRRLPKWLPVFLSRLRSWLRELFISAILIALVAWLMMR